MAEDLPSANSSYLNDTSGGVFFPAYSLTEKGALVFTMACISFLAIPGNCLVIYVISRVHNMKTSTNTLLLNLCIADLLIAAFYLPFVTVDLYITDHWIFGGFMCRIVSFSQSVGTKASILILTALSLERYLTVCKSNLVIVTARNTCIICIVLWGVAIAFTLPLLIAKTTISIEENEYCIESWTSSHAIIYTLVVLTLFYFVPLIVMTALYAKIGKKLFRSTRRTNSMRLSISSNKLTVTSKARLTKICVTIILSFALSWAPTHILTLVYYFSEMTPESYTIVNMIIFPIVSCVAFSNCALNPLLYCYMSQNFRNALKTEWKRLIRRKDDSFLARLPGVLTSLRVSQNQHLSASRMSSRVELQGSRSRVNDRQCRSLDTSLITIFESAV